MNTVTAPLHGQVETKTAGGVAQVACIAALVLFVAGTAVLLLLRQGNIVQVTFPILSMAVGALLFFSRPTFFLGFAWWLWFLTPEVRRLVDFQGGWHPVNPIMLAPLLVSSLAIVTVVQHAPALRLRSLFGFVPIFIALAYGTIVGIVTTGPAVAIYSLLTWLAPILLAFHLAVRWQEYEFHKATLFSVFGWGTLVMGGYGVIQYYFAPDWDGYWLVNSGMINQGQPFPQAIRVFSTMNSSGPFAFVITAGILLLVESRSRLKLPMAVLGLAGLMLSLVRAAWLGGILGLAYMLLFLRGRNRLRLIALSACFAVLLGAASLSGPGAAVVAKRMDTLTNLEDDGSYQQRQDFYLEFAIRSLINPIGAGIGSTSYVTKLDNYGEIVSGFYGDSGIMQVPFVLGWLGSLFYVGGIVALVRAGFRRSAAPRDSFVQISRAIVLMVTAEMVFENTLINAMGACFWTFLGMSLAAQRFHAPCDATSAPTPHHIAIMSQTSKEDAS